MIGVIERPASIAEQKLADETDALVFLAKAGHRVRRVIGVEYRTRPYAWSRAMRIRGLRRCAALSKQFREVERDKSATRMMEGSHGSKVELPLIFHSRLPLKTKTTITVHGYRDSYSATAISPSPTIEALEEIRKHKHKFDAIEVWWVPNDVLVEKIPDPDPIVVGVVIVGDDKFFYELHRWVDEDVELGWWSKEAY